MSENEKLINEIKKQIETLKQEIKDKELFLSSLIELLENMDDNN